MDAGINYEMSCNFEYFVLTYFPTALDRFGFVAAGAAVEDLWQQCQVPVCASLGGG